MLEGTHARSTVLAITARLVGVRKLAVCAVAGVAVVAEANLLRLRMELAANCLGAVLTILTRMAESTSTMAAVLVLARLEGMREDAVLTMALIAKPTEDNLVVDKGASLVAAPASVAARTRLCDRRGNNCGGSHCWMCCKVHCPGSVISLRENYIINIYSGLQ
jgi:hypothetical protein